MAQPQRWGKLTQDTDLDAWLDRHDKLAAPGWVVTTLFKSLRESVVNLSRMARERAARSDALETRLAELERKSMRFEGVHAPGTAYGAGAAVVRSGSLWIARTATTATPGPADTERTWQLAVKRGEVER